MHYEIEFIHPFEDGNGRMGRFWQTLILANYNHTFSYLPVESIIKDNQKKYYTVLENCDKTGESTLFIEFILELVLESIKEFSGTINNVVMNTEQRLGMAKNFFKQSLFSRKDYMTYFKNISSATASRDLRDGVEEGLLKKEGKGNQTKYKFEFW